MKSGQETCGDNMPPSDSTPRNTLESGFNILGRGKTTWEKLQHLTRAKNNGKGKKEKKAIKLEAGFTTMTKVF